MTWYGRQPREHPGFGEEVKNDSLVLRIQTPILAELEGKRGRPKKQSVESKLFCQSRKA